MIPYTYILTHLPSGKQYYGVRTANKLPPKDDLWNTYFSCGVRVKQLIKTDGKNSFSVKIDKTFVTAEEAIKYEKQYLESLNLPNDHWLNLNISGAIVETPEVTERRRKAQTGKKHSSESRKKRSEAMKKFWSIESNKQKALGANNHWYGKTHSDDTKHKLSKLASSRPRKPHSEETKQKMSAPRSPYVLLCCSHCGKEGRGGNMTRYHFNNCKKYQSDL
jgi:hypothetical protein